MELVPFPESRVLVFQAVFSEVGSLFPSRECDVLRLSCDVPEGS